VDGVAVTREREVPGYGLRIAFWTLAALIAIDFELYHVWSGRRIYTSLDYVLGLTDGPFQYRWLAGLLARPVLWVLQETGAAARAAGLPQPFDDPATLALVAVDIGFLIGTAAVVKAHLRHLGFAPLWARALALAFLLLLPHTVVLANYLEYWHPYDLSAVFFFALCLWLAAIGRMGWFAVAFALGCVAKETIVVAALIVCTWRLREGLRRALGWCALHLAIAALVRLALKAVLAGTSANKAMFVDNLEMNLGYLANPSWWPQMLSTFAFLWIPVVVRFRDVTDPLLRHACLWMVPYCGAMLFAAQIPETRVYGELAPAFFLAACLVGRALARRESAAGSRETGCGG
jgi:hypothetical protein